MVRVMPVAIVFSRCVPVILHFFYLNLARNSGLSAAMKAGIDYADSIYVGYMDADLQTTPEDFNLLLKDITHYELVMGHPCQPQGFAL